MWAVLGMCVIAVTIFTAGFLIGQRSVGVVDRQRIHPPDNGAPMASRTPTRSQRIAVTLDVLWPRQSAHAAGTRHQLY